MRVLITGANGMAARATTEHCRATGDEVFALTRKELDITQMHEVERVIGEVHPAVVINCAAYTDVDGAETNQDLSYGANALGPANLAAVCGTAGSILITISTDFVFDGRSEGFYTQHDTPNPLGVYAKSKYEGEIRVREANSSAIVVRSGWIFGEGGTNFLSVMPRLLAEGKSITAISDSFGTPTYAADLARRLRELAQLNEPGTFHVTNSGEGTSYFEFAREVARVRGFDASLIRPVSHSELKRPAPRPLSSKMRCLYSEKLGLAPLPDWRDAVRRFVARD